MATNLPQISLFILLCHFLFAQAYWPPIPPGLPELQCETYDEKDHTCTAPTTIHSGFYWNMTDTIVKFSTYGDIRAGTYCQIFIAAKTVVFKYSNIMSCDIYINATNLLIDHSSLSTTGSTLYGKGWTNSTDFGNSYAAFGGFCSNSQVLDFTYGNYDTPYTSEAETYGSGGPNSRGGGKIVIIAESFSLAESTISSNGYPEAIADCLTTQENGGTGGYIYIQSDYIYPPKDSSSFEAKGGISCSPETFGGSGGRIIINGPVTSRCTYVNGGKSESSICNAGGSGTVYYPSTNLLFISNNNNDSIATAPTTLESAPNVNLSIVSGAFVMPKNTSFNKLQASLSYKSIQVSNHAKFGCPDYTGTAYNLNLTTGSLSISDNSAIACNGELRFAVTDLSLTNVSTLSSSGSKIMLNATRSFYSNNSSRVIFNPTTTLQNSTIILQTQKADILSQSVFNASFIVINAESLNLAGGLVSTNQTCFNVDLPQRYVLNALDYRLKIDLLKLYYEPAATLENFMAKFITSQYTSYLLVEKTLTLKNTLINAARIGIFAHDIAMDNWTNITSDGLGCPSDLGPGHGIGILFTTNCGSTGGGHGGVGGIGSGIYVASTACISQTAYGQSLYGNPNSPIDEGSGGASYSEAQGGSGGGVIVLGAMDSLRVDGMITANGLAPAVNPSGGYKGAGSGSGGSIQLFMTFLYGTGNISVSGGDSCDICSGGEGGGGRVKLNYPAVFSGKDLFKEVHLKHPTISASKGKRFNTIKTPDKMNASFFLAYDGSIVSTPCPPGHFGLFCEPCGINYYKSDFSNSECSQCLDITGSAESQIYAQTTYLCAYNCTFSYQDSGMLHCAGNIVSYAFLIGTHYAFIFLISALALIVFSLIWAWQHERFSSSLVKNESPSPALERLPSLGSKSPKAAAAAGNNQPEPVTFTKNHVQRIPLLGDNLPENRWFINMDLVNFKEISLIRESIDTLRKDINRDTMWKRWWIFTLRLLIVFNFSLYLFCAQHFRKKIQKRIQKDVNFANQELKDLCRMKGIPTYFIVFRSTFGMSYGYLDIFQEGINFIQDNCREPISIMLAGNGSFFSPYHLDRKDEIFEHFTDKWIEFNFPKINDFEKLIFQDRVKEFVKKFNKEAKYIDYYSNFNELRNSIYRLNYYIKLSSLEFLQNYGVYFYLYGLEIPKYTVEESDTTQPFLQSPIRATFLTNQKARVLDDFIEKTQRIKHIENSDFKLCLLIKSTLDPAPEKEINLPKPEVFKDITESFRPEEKELESLNDVTSADDVLTLKEALFTKLDACINAEQYSIPKDLVTKYKGRKPNLNGKKYYKEPKKFFVKMKKIGQFFFRIKKNKLTKTQLYLIAVPLIFFEFFFLWFKTVLFIDYKSDFGMIASLLIPFPFSPALAPYFGIISIVSSSFRLTQYFMVFNLLSLANKMVDVIFAATMFYPDYLYLAMMIFSFMNSLFVQIISNYLADVQHK